MNTFLSTVKSERNIYSALKYHSFRIGFVNSIIQKSDIAKAAQLVEHKSLDTTKR
jgi:hypothetical protein